jgi:hypothetical protein
VSGLTENVGELPQFRESGDGDYGGGPWAAIASTPKPAQLTRATAVVERLADIQVREAAQGRRLSVQLKE